MFDFDKEDVPEHIINEFRSRYEDLITELEGNYDKMKTIHVVWYAFYNWLTALNIYYNHDVHKIAVLAK